MRRSIVENNGADAVYGVHGGALHDHCCSGNVLLDVLPADDCLHLVTVAQKLPEIIAATKMFRPEDRQM